MDIYRRLSNGRLNCVFRMIAQDAESVEEDKRFDLLDDGMPIYFI